MPPRPGESPKDVSLREYLESRLESVEKATTLAAASMEKRLEGMNEFRETLKDQAGRFITRSELEAIVQKFEVQFEKYEAEVRGLRTSRDTLAGKASHNSVLIGWGLALLAIVVAFAAYVKQ